MSEAPIRVGVVDDHAIVRNSLRQFLEEQPGLQVVGEAGSGRDAVDLVKSVDMDVLVMDLSMPGQTGIDALGSIRAKAPGVRVLVLTMYPEEQFAVTLLKLGASGFLNKSAEPEEIVQAIKALAAGERYVTPATVAALVATVTDGPRAPHEALTDRELQVFLKLAHGDEPRIVEASLHLQPEVLEACRASVLRKLGLQTEGQLTYYALKHGLIE